MTTLGIGIGRKERRGLMFLVPLRAIMLCMRDGPTVPDLYVLDHVRNEYWYRYGRSSVRISLVMLRWSPWSRGPARRPPDGRRAAKGPVRRFILMRQKKLSLSFGDTFFTQATARSALLSGDHYKPTTFYRPAAETGQTSKNYFANRKMHTGSNGRHAILSSGRTANIIISTVLHVPAHSVNRSKTYFHKRHRLTHRVVNAVGKKCLANNLNWCR